MIDKKAANRLAIKNMRKSITAKLWPILFLMLFIPVGCSDSNQVTLRKFPYPYKAALAICSDIDETESIEEFLTIQEFLSGSGETEIGPGLGLEIGNSLWFYNQSLHGTGTDTDKLMETSQTFRDNPDSGISLFIGMSDSLNPYADCLTELIRLGYIDALHSYGHFDKSGFSRHLAERAIAFLRQKSLTVDVFINHGGRENRNNLGDASWFEGDNKESGNYHADITTKAGIKFLWRGHLTHCVGQDGELTFLNRARLIYEAIQDIFFAAQDFPHNNRLVNIFDLDDGQKLFEFVRFINPWGKYSTADEEFIGFQLGPDVIDQLIENRGNLIFYTHLGSNKTGPVLHRKTVEALRYIKEKNRQGDLLVTTTSRLLNYNIHHRYLFWHSQSKADSLIIRIDSIANPVEGSYVPESCDLAGITFYVPDDRLIAIQINGLQLEFIVNRRDERGKSSVTIPWAPLPTVDSLFRICREASSF